MICADAPPALVRLGIAGSSWPTQVGAVETGYGRAIGAPERLLEKAAAMDQRWLKGLGTARLLMRG